MPPDNEIPEHEEPIDVIQKAQLGDLPDSADEPLDNANSIEAIEKKVGSCYL